MRLDHKLYTMKRSLHLLTKFKFSSSQPSEETVISFVIRHVHVTKTNQFFGRSLFFKKYVYKRRENDF